MEYMLDFLLDLPGFHWIKVRCVSTLTVKAHLTTKFLSQALIAGLGARAKNQHLFQVQHIHRRSLSYRGSFPKHSPQLWKKARIPSAWMR